MIITSNLALSWIKIFTLDLEKFSMNDTLMLLEIYSGWKIEPKEKQELLSLKPKYEDKGNSP